jgi:CMP-N-acetylneuraminic acid synthetase
MGGTSCTAVTTPATLQRGLPPNADRDDTRPMGGTAPEGRDGGLRGYSHRWNIVPARSGSVGVPDKNRRRFAGGPCLIERAVETARQLGGQILLTTDYAVDALPTWVRPYYVPRPPHLATNTASMLDVLCDLGEKCGWTERDQIVLLQPTSLAIPHTTRDEVILVGPWLSSLKTVISAHRVPSYWHPFYCQDSEHPHLPPACRQTLPERYRPNGLFYIMNGRTARMRSLWSAPVVFAVCDCYNIDTPKDWADAERSYG